MKRSTFNYVRSHRALWGLTATDLSRLLGKYRTTASRIAHCSKPTFYAATALQVIFGVEPREMFPGFYERVEDAVMGRAVKFMASLDGKTDKQSERKRELLNDMMRRAASNASGV